MTVLSSLNQPDQLHGPINQAFLNLCIQDYRQISVMHVLKYDDESLMTLAIADFSSSSTISLICVVNILWNAMTFGTHIHNPPLMNYNALAVH